MNTEKHICDICGIREAHYYFPKLKIWCCKRRKDKCKGPPKPGICKVCGKQHDGTVGRGDFCSRACASKYNLINARKSEKYKEHVNNNSWRGNHEQAEYGRWKCNECNIIFRIRDELIKHNKELHPEKIKTKGGSWRKGHNKNEPGFEWMKEQAARQIEMYQSGKLIPSFQGKHHTKETRELLSRKRTEYILKNLSTGKRPDVKWYEYPNINGESFKHQGTWELEIAKWLNQNNILWIKNRTVKYQTSDGVNKLYIPDFYLPETNQYIEIKGYFPEEDKIKMNNIVYSNPTIEIFFIHGKKRLNKVLNGKEQLQNLIYRMV